MTKFAAGLQATAQDAGATYSVDDFGKDIDPGRVFTSAADPLLDRLTVFAALPDDWDGYGATAPDAEVLRLAEVAISAFNHKGCLPTKLMPGVANDVAMVWERDGFRVMLEISTEEWDWSIEYDDDREDEFYDARGEVGACAERVRETMLNAQG